MIDVTNAIKNTIPISNFNKGLAGKIFEEVKKTGTKVVIKNNTPECVLLSTDEYLELMNKLNDAYLLEIANERLENLDLSKAKKEEDIIRNLGLSNSELDNFDEVEFE